MEMSGAKRSPEATFLLPTFVPVSCTSERPTGAKFPKMRIAGLFITTWQVSGKVGIWGALCAPQTPTLRCEFENFAKLYYSCWVTDYPYICYGTAEALARLVFDAKVMGKQTSAFLG